MKENNRQRKSLVSYISVTLVALFLTVLNLTGKNNVFANFAAPPTPEVNCETYFNPYNGYTSLSDLILDFNNDTLNFYDEVKTWGTVSKVYFNSSGAIKSFYIESTSREGKSAAMLIYNYRGSVNVTENNVLTVTGYVSVHNDRPQMIDPFITIDYTENSSPVTPLLFTEEFLIEQDSITLFENSGPLLVKMENVYLSAVNSTTALVKWQGGYYAATLYYNSLYTQDDIWSKLYDSYY
ncbi:MAG TPA: hypothetical protein VFD05_02800, partial [Bacilli bacterium]|nr:hypothetical protein [Bacilli bacterium]